jgi:putative ABC transport system ATP-binding protein
MLEIISLTKRYRQEIIFFNVNLHLPSTGWVLIQGPSGSGKTTFLKCISQLLPYEGSIRMQGIALEKLTASAHLQYRQHHLGSVDQTGNWLPFATVADHLNLVKRIKGNWHHPLLRRYAERFLKEVTLTQRIETLSKGQQQRFAILLACLGAPKILLLDEPTAGLDYQNRVLIYELLDALKSFMLIVMSSHVVPGDQLPYTSQLNFPLIPTPTLARQTLKNRFPPKAPSLRLSTAWLLQFHLRKRRWEPYRFQTTFFQALAMSMLGVMIAFSFVLETELVKVSETMLGGQYQWLQKEISPAFEIRSTVKSDLQFLPSDGKEWLVSSYDQHHLDSLKPYQSFYYDYRGIMTPLRDFHLGIVNQVSYLPWVPSLKFWTTPLEDDEIILGIQGHHLQQLSIILNTRPTISAVNEVLRQQSLSIYVHLSVDEWAYEDTILFQLCAVIDQVNPTWYHTNPDYLHVLFEQRMRLPTKGLEENYYDQPWRLMKTMQILTRESEGLISSWQNDLRFQHLHLQRLDVYRWQVFKTSLPRPNLPVFLNPNAYHYHSEVGYHYYPHQRLSGFALPFFFSPQAPVSLSYLETLEKLTSPYQWLQVIPPPATSIGHILASPQAAIKWQPRFDLPSLKRNEVIISSTLANQWQVKSGAFVHVALPRYHPNATLGLIGDYAHQTWRIQGIIKEKQLKIFQEPHWLEHQLILEGNFPSYHLLPQAWINFSDAIQPNGYTQVHPYQEIQQQLKKIQEFLLYGWLGFFIIFGLPAMVLFHLYLQQHLNQEKRQIHILLGFGAPLVMVQQWYRVRLQVIFLELWLPSVMLFFSLDWLMKKTLYDRFYLMLSWQFPYEASLLWLGLWLGFYVLMVLGIDYRIRGLTKKY